MSDILFKLKSNISNFSKFTLSKMYIISLKYKFNFNFVSSSKAILILYLLICLNYI